MSLYELVLRFPDREETRFTDRPVSVGAVLSIGRGRWQVVGRTAARSPSPIPVTEAFLCERSPGSAGQAASAS